ncbi:hypothetical protein FACS189481_4900 [Clostridia bacterium]|nr:hypothetical protein FACS189481_4900 [Clostridia bacterium]
MCDAKEISRKNTMKICIRYGASLSMNSGKKYSPIASPINPGIGMHENKEMYILNFAVIWNIPAIRILK